MALMRYRPRGSEPDDVRLGRFVPDDWKHREKFPAKAVFPKTISVVERTLVLPYWHWLHDQGYEGSCVGHGISMERAISNQAQNKILARFRPWTRRYDPLDCWDWAKAHDQWPDTNPGDDNGTSVNAGYEYQRVEGPRRIKTKGITLGSDGHPRLVGTPKPNDASEGVSTYRWATRVDEMRTALSNGIPVVIGVNWYSNFDKPVKYDNDYWVGRDQNLGQIRGGHCVCVYGASDKRQAFKIKNSWGRSYPLIYMPYSAMQRLLDEDGEAALVTDR
jgi:hypothetical protein